MHKPFCETEKIEILTFEDAKKHSDKSAEYDRDRWIYVPDFYSEYRYILGTRGENPLIVLGINPSTAAPDDLDNTLKSAQRIAKYNGYDSFIMFNVYAQRATNPDDMDRCFNRKLHEENMKAFRYILSLSGGRVSIWAAFGAIIEKREYLKFCVADMAEIAKEFNSTWYTAGKISIKGHPHHPLYLKKDSVLDKFDMDSYIENVLKIHC